MATITWVVFKHHRKADGTYNPKIRVYHNGSTAYIPSKSIRLWSDLNEEIQWEQSPMGLYRTY